MRRCTTNSKSLQAGAVSHEKMSPINHSDCSGGGLAENILFTAGRLGTVTGVIEAADADYYPKEEYLGLTNAVDLILIKITSIAC